MNTVTITLRNTGSVPVDASVIEFSDPDRFSAGTAPGIIAPGATAPLDVNFHPAAEPGTHTAVLIIRAGNIKIPLTAETLAGPEIIIPEHLDDPLLHRIVEQGDEKWFEVGFDSPVLLTGSAADGWTEPTGCITIRQERSEDLVNWDNDFIPCPTSPETIPEGYRYWVRSKYPMDSKVKTGMLEISSGPTYGQPFQTPGNISPDTRNNPFTALTILGVSRALGGFPYTMPTDAARMQTDLAAIFTGATVEAVDDVNWRIRIPNITFSQYEEVNKVFWPVYLVEDMFGVLNTPVDGAGFSGRFVNTAGVRTSVMKQFARDRISPGPNYPW